MGDSGTNGNSGRHRWVFDVLQAAGAASADRGDGTYDVELGPTLSTQLKRTSLRMTFRKRLALREGIESAAPGSWLHDQLLRYARERGQVVRPYLVAREDIDRAAVLAQRRRGFREPETLRNRRYGNVIQLSFRVAYYSEPPRETVLHLAYDEERGKHLARPVARPLVWDARPAPEADIDPAPKPDLAAAFHGAWERVQDEVETRVNKLEQEGRELLEKELRTVERYYRQLIDEEKRLLKSRSSRRGQDESREKIDMLKLEWQRRVKEETDRLRPQVVASLSAVAVIQTPLELWRCRFEDGSTRDLWLDLARGDSWEARKPATRRRSKARKRARNGK